MEEIFRAKINKEGRMVIPHACRQKLEIELGQDHEVLIRLEKDGLHLMTFNQALANFQDQVAALTVPRTGLAEVVIVDHQPEAASEARE